MDNLEISYCKIDRLYVVRNHDGQTIGVKKTKPTEDDLSNIVKSDQWAQRFEAMRSGKRVRVSDRIYWAMLGSVPPIKQTADSFYCGEPYSGSYHYYFERQGDGAIYGQLKQVK